MLSVFTKGIRLFKRDFKIIATGSSYTSLMATESGCVSLEEEINNGWCIPLAIWLEWLGRRNGYLVEIVRSYSHWFIRVYLGGEEYYLDAWVEEGTKDLLDITDNLAEELEVWEVKDLLKLQGVENKSKLIIQAILGKTIGG